MLAARDQAASAAAVSAAPSGASAGRMRHTPHTPHLRPSQPAAGTPTLQPAVVSPVLSASDAVRSPPAPPQQMPAPPQQQQHTPQMLPQPPAFVLPPALNAWGGAPAAQQGGYAMPPPAQPLQRGDGSLPPSPALLPAMSPSALPVATPLCTPVATPLTLPSEMLEEVEGLSLGGAKDCDQPPPAAVGVEPPCSHNQWDNVRAKKDCITLRCRECQERWKACSSRLRRCPDFPSGSCPRGDQCTLVHIHRFKQSTRNRRKQEPAAADAQQGDAATAACAAAAASGRGQQRSEGGAAWA
eukprot:TRINITY_DN9225_c0_g1_i3.p2 TRINITY_DN9225_c0_g1~~TRINITY_DN9225_c0_g1_i3.p2  ORF type:complete len:298 (+),score=114.80 TRINITY_DN9225_c0_g1_i3:460-1353(+)